MWLFLPRCRTLHLLLLNLSRFLFIQYSSLAKSCCMAVKHSGVSATPPSFVPSANQLRMHSVPSFRSQTKVLNTTRLNTQSPTPRKFPFLFLFLSLFPFFFLLLSTWWVTGKRCQNRHLNKETAECVKQHRCTQRRFCTKKIQAVVMVPVQFGLVLWLIRPRDPQNHALGKVKEEKRKGREMGLKQQQWAKGEN